MEAARPLDLGEPPAKLRDPLPHPPPIDLELGLAGAARADTAAEPGEMRPLPREPRQEVLQLGQLDLHLALEAPRPLREDVEDEGAPVDDLPVAGPLEVPLLGGRERIVEDDDVRRGGVRDGADLLDLTRPDERRGMDAAERLDHLPGDDQPGRLGEACELRQRLARREGEARPFRADEDGALASDGRRLGAVAHRKYITPVPRMRSTALTIWSVAATRSDAGSARTVSCSVPFSRCRKASHDPGCDAKTSRSVVRASRARPAREMRTWTWRIASAWARASGVTSSAITWQRSSETSSAPATTTGAPLWMTSSWRR